MFHLCMFEFDFSLLLSTVTLGLWAPWWPQLCPLWCRYVMNPLVHRGWGKKSCNSVRSWQRKWKARLWTVIVTGHWGLTSCLRFGNEMASVTLKAGKYIFEATIYQLRTGKFSEWGCLRSSQACLLPADTDPQVTGCEPQGLGFSLPEVPEEILASYRK